MKTWTTIHYGTYSILVSPNKYEHEYPHVYFEAHCFLNDEDRKTKLAAICTLLNGEKPANAQEQAKEEASERAFAMGMINYTRKEINDDLYP